MSEKFVFAGTEPTMMAHPAVVEPRTFKDDNGKEKGDPKYGMTLCFDPDSEDFKRFKALAIKAAKDKWPGKDCGKEYKEGNLLMPWESGDAAADRRVKKLMDLGKIKEDDKKGDFQRGKMNVKSSSKYPVGLSIVSGGKIVEVAGDGAKAHADKFFYFGAEVLSELVLQPYNPVGKDGKAGVTAYLQKVLSTGKGERIKTGGKSATETFSGYAGKISAEDPGSNDTAGSTEDWDG